MATQDLCEKALDLYEQDLTRLKNVVGLGIVSSKEDDPEDRDCAVAVYVRKKISRDKLAAKDLVPETLEIHTRSKTVKVATRVIEQGEVRQEKLGG